MVAKDGPLVRKASVIGMSTVHEQSSLSDRGANTSRGQKAEPSSAGVASDATRFVPSPQSDAQGHRGPAEVMGSPVAEANSFYTPPGMDHEAYAAGERAAMGRALNMLLPSQQALGMLSGGLQRLEERVQEEAAHSRQAQVSTADARALIQSLHQRMDQLEKVRLPDMDSRIQHAIEAPLSQEFQATLLGLQGALGDLASRRNMNEYSLTGFAIRQLSWLGATASLYAQKALSKADVAAIIVSRKILLDNRVTGLIGPAAPAEGAVGQELSKNTRSVFGALLFLSAVESAWQMHSRAFCYVPLRLRKATTPLQLGLRIMRGATWAATLTLSAVYFRRACYLLADKSISGLDRAVQSCHSMWPFSRGSFGVSRALPELQATADADVQLQAQDALLKDEGEGINAPGQSKNAKAPPQRQRSIFDTPPPSPPP